jgi:peroxiredoxin
MKKFFSSFIFSLIAACALANNGYNIRLTVTNIKDTKAYLAFYYNGKTYSKDSTMLDAKGMGVFSGTEKLPEGVYIVYFNPDRYFDLLVGADQNIKIKTDASDFSKTTVSGGSESVKFQELINFMGKMHKEQSELRQKYTDQKIDSLTFVKELNRMSDEVAAYQNKQITENEGTFFAGFIKGTIPVEVPEMVNLPDSVRPMARYQHMKNHFFDNINLSDPRFLRTPYFPTKVDNFISKNIIQIPDSLAETAINLIEKSRANEETFQVMTSRMMNYALKSQMMGMDAMWLALADKYYFSGVATWADSAWVEDLRKEAKKIRHNLIGMEAHNLIVRDSSNRVVNLKDVPADFVLVYFYEPSCGHCKKNTPPLHDSVYVKWKDKGFEVFAFYTQTERKEWMDFVNKHHLHDWVNVWDPYRESWFWEYYDTSSTPGVYLLDKNRKIIAKKVNNETLNMILEQELKKKQ